MNDQNKVSSNEFLMQNGHQQLPNQIKGPVYKLESDGSNPTRVLVNKFKRRNLNSHESSSKVCPLMAGGARILNHVQLHNPQLQGNNPIDQQGAAIINISQTVSVGDRLQVHKQLTANGVRPDSFRANGQHKLHPIDTGNSLISLLQNNYRSESRHKSNNYRNSLNTRGQQHFNGGQTGRQLASNLIKDNQHQEKTVQNILQIGQIKPSGLGKLSKQQKHPSPTTAIGGKHPSQYQYQPSMPVLGVFGLPEGFTMIRPDELKGNSIELNKNNSKMINVLSDKHNFDLENGRIVTLDGGAYASSNEKQLNFQKKNTKSICFPMIQSPLKLEEDCTAASDPMNTKHFDQLRNYEFGGREDKKNSVPNQQNMLIMQKHHDQLQMQTHHSEASFRPLAGGGTTRSIPHSGMIQIRNPIISKANYEAIGDRSANLNGSIGPHGPMYLLQRVDLMAPPQRSESTDYMIGSFTEQQQRIAVDTFEKAGVYTQKRQKNNVSKVNSIEASPSRQKRKSPFAQHGHRMVTEDLFKIQSVQNTKINGQNSYNGSATINPNAFIGPGNKLIEWSQAQQESLTQYQKLNSNTVDQQQLNKKLSYSQQGPYRNEMEVTRQKYQYLHDNITPTQLKSKFMRADGLRAVVAAADSNKDAIDQSMSTDVQVTGHWEEPEKNRDKIEQLKMHKNQMNNPKTKVQESKMQFRNGFQNQPNLDLSFKFKKNFQDNKIANVSHQPQLNHLHFDGFLNIQEKNKSESRKIEISNNNYGQSDFISNDVYANQKFLKVQEKFNPNYNLANSIQYSTDVDGQIVYGGQIADEDFQDEQMLLNGSGQWIAKQQNNQHDLKALGFGFDCQNNDNTIQMFYGDYKDAEEDEPEEDDMSKQDCSKSQFSEELSGDGAAEDAESEVESPGLKIQEQADNEQDAEEQIDEKHEEEFEQKTDNPNNVAPAAPEQRQSEMKSEKLTKEQAKFLNMLQNSKQIKPEQPKINGKTPKIGSRQVPKKSNKKQNKKGKQKKKKNFIDEDEESNYEQDDNQSDVGSTPLLNKDVQVAQFKQLLLKKGEEQITEDMTIQEKYLNRPPNGRIVLNYGPIPGRYPSVFFNYPPFLKMQRPFKSDKIQVITQDQLQPYSYLSFKISNQTNTYNCVVNALKTAGFYLVKYGNGPTSFNIIWSPLYKASKLKSMNQYQKINHFPGSWTIGCKSSLWKCVQKYRRKFGKDFEICPQTYVFPEDYKRWCTDREMNNYKDLYILKPVAASCGKGIKVIGKKDRIPQKNGYLVSKYVSRPHLLRGFKYDLRIYILVTSYEPLKAYIFREGLVRLATQPYSTTKGSLKKRYVHLTNYSINKYAENYSKNEQTDKTNIQQSKESTTISSSKNEGNEKEEEKVESKWSLKMLREEYKRVGIDYEEVFGKIKELCVKTLITVETPIASNMRSIRHKGNCFEIYGFDVLIDRDFKPWLLEINVGPSLSSSSPFDKQVKSILLSDSLHLSGFTVFDRAQILQRQKMEKQQRLIRNLGQFQNQNGNTQNIESSTINQPMQPVSKPKLKLKNRDNSFKKDSSQRVQEGQNEKLTAGQSSLSPRKLRMMPEWTETSSLPDQVVTTMTTVSRYLGPVKTTSLGNQQQRGDGNNGVDGGGHAHRFKVKDKYAIHSFLSGFEYLTEEDLELLASFEEEQQRRSQTNFERIFPTKDNIETMNKYFEQSRHSNTLLWQYIRQKCPINSIKAYYKNHPLI